MIKKIGLRKNILFWLIPIIVASLLIIWPMFRQGFWQSDDGEWMIIRFSSFHESLRDGHFPVRWTQRLNHSFGYPVINFLYPLPFYLAEIPYILGFGFVGSIKAVFVASVIVSGLGMFLFARKWGNEAGLIATILYLFAPYRIFLTFTRGSLGESVALAVVPMVFLSIDKLKRKTTWNNISLCSISYAALIMSHNVIALIFTPFIISYFLYIYRKNISSIYNQVLAFFLGFVLSAFFWLPALWELQFTKASGIVISEYKSYFLSSSQLISMLGMIPILFVILAIIRKSFFFPIAAAIASILIHPVSSPVLKLFPLIQKIQFPWRLSSLFMFSAAAAAAQAVKKIKIRRYNLKIIAVFVALLSFIPAFLAMQKINFVNREEGFYSTNDDTTTVKNEFTPMWVEVEPQNKPDDPYIIQATPGSFEVTNSEFRTGFQYLQVRLQETATITFNTHYFPGWKLFIDGEEIVFNPEEANGLIKTQVEPGRNKLRDIKVVFTKTKVRLISELFSFTTFLLLIFLIIHEKFKKQNIKKTLATVALLLAISNIGFFLLTNLRTYRQIFRSQIAEKSYLNSQWVNPDFATSVPIGDSGLYNWAGWEYIHGKNPILINAEMPPLGKYIIGVGLLITKRPAFVGLVFSIFALVTHFFLAKEILKDRWLAIISTSLLSVEPIMTNLFNVTMLDALQLGFINLALLFFIKGIFNRKWFFASSLMLGFSATTKFLASTSAIAFSLIFFLVLTKKWKQLKYFVISLPVIGVVHLASYASFFLHGNNLIDYLGVQKWIVNFYRQGNVGTVPVGSYWLLVLFNKWRVWFGQEWGMFTTISSDQWRITWPINVIAVASAVVLTMRNKLGDNYRILIIWLLVYSLFLTFIIGWPHYMLLYLPFSYIVLIKLINNYLPIVYDKLSKEVQKK